ncbi:MAG: ABC transporter permease [Gammaproteobacteria bacterium]|nr:ABC transporter permease [Gammaproteobacteria bacterium]
MNPGDPARHPWVAFRTLVRKELFRFLRIWVQTLVPPAITMGLYFVIFGNLIGSRVGTMDGFPYMQYIAPGIIMMSVITNSYANVVSSLFSAKFQRFVEEILVSPMPDIMIITGYVAGGVMRGLMVGAVVTAVALCFTDLNVASPLLTLCVVLLTATLFSLAGYINALFARKFDDISIVPTFILTPLTYLGGVFYSVNLLPPFWERLSHANPVFYMVNAFRQGMLGRSDVAPETALAVIAGGIVVLFSACVILMRRGTGLRN